MLQNINDINNDAQQEQLQYMAFLDNFLMGKEKAFKNVESQRYLMEIEHKPLDMKQNNNDYQNKVNDDLIKRFIGENKDNLLLDGFNFNFVDLERIKTDVINNSMFINDEKHIRILMKKEIQRKQNISDGKNFVTTIKLFFEQLESCLLRIKGKKVTVNKKEATRIH